MRIVSLSATLISKKVLTLHNAHLGLISAKLKARLGVSKHPFLLTCQVSSPLYNLVLEYKIKKPVQLKKRGALHP